MASVADVAARRGQTRDKPAKGSNDKGTGGSRTARAPSLDAIKAGINTASLTSFKSIAGAEGFRIRTFSGGDGRFWWGLATSQGRRPEMEDAHAVDLQLDQRTAMFAVLDGHAGKEVAQFCATHLRAAIEGSPSFARGNLESALGEAFISLERAMSQPRARGELFRLSRGISAAEFAARPELVREAEAYGTYEADTGRYLGPAAGCTCVVALVRDDTLCVASVGDSRCVLSDDGRAVALTRDHKAKDPEEAKRVVKAGLSIERNRVRAPNSSLAMTRALGDSKYKQAHLPPHQQAVSPVPETVAVEVDMLAGAAAGTPEAGHLGCADFVVLACDGLWDCLTNQQAVTFLQVAMERGLSPEEAAQALVDEALADKSVTPATLDNITVLVVQLAPMPDAAP